MKATLAQLTHDQAAVCKDGDADGRTETEMNRDARLLPATRHVVRAKRLIPTWLSQPPITVRTVQRSLSICSGFS